MQTFKLPYYAVIFTSTLNDDSTGYEEMAKKMEALATKQPGFLGLESARAEVGITVSYWESEESILQWKQQAEHQLAQKMGKNKWYKKYAIRIAKVERDYSF